MRKVFLSLAVVATITTCIFWACSKDENTLNSKRTNPKSTEELDIDYYYSLGEGHNQILEKLHSMDIPEDMNTKDIAHLIGDTEYITLFDYEFISKLKSFEEFGITQKYSHAALIHCKNLDKFPSLVIPQEIKSIDDIIETIYSYATEQMHAVYNDFENNLLSETEKESLLTMLGVYSKSAEYWLLFFINQQTQTKKLIAFNPEFGIWYQNCMQAASLHDAASFSRCQEQLTETSNPYSIPPSSEAVNNACGQISASCSLGGAREDNSQHPMPGVFL